MEEREGGRSPHKHIHKTVAGALTNTYTSCPHKHLHRIPPQTPTPHAHLILKGVYVEIIELMRVCVALRTYVSVNCTHTFINSIRQAIKHV